MNFFLYHQLQVRIECIAAVVVCERCVVPENNRVRCILPENNRLITKRVKKSERKKCVFYATKTYHSSHF